MKEKNHMRAECNKSSFFPSTHNNYSEASTMFETNCENKGFRVRTFIVTAPQAPRRGLNDNATKVTFQLLANAIATPETKVEKYCKVPPILSPIPSCILFTSLTGNKHRGTELGFQSNKLKHKDNAMITNML
jgi:hypothetical protein